MREKEGEEDMVKAWRRIKSGEIGWAGRGFWIPFIFHLI
jgi:hypothetical protein